MPVTMRQKRGVGKVIPPSVQHTTYPACVGGVNALDSIMAMPPQDCLYTYNLMPVEYGLRLRQGYREWAINVGPTGDDNVRTIVPYESPSDDPADDRLWAVTENGIYDITLFNDTAPVEDVAFIQQGDSAGFGVFCEFTSLSSDHYLFYADGLNGIHQYSDATQLWTVPTSWTYDVPGGAADQPFPVADVAFVMVHKLRIWVILENSTDAFYLPVASVAGKLELFTFGAKMDHGGNLQGLWQWTLDGGDGIDDYLVALSRGGDLMIYRGADPIAADWGLTGVWFIGETPRSRRLIAQHGADIYALTTFGLTSLRDLIGGTPADMERVSAGAKVSRFLRADVNSGKDFHEWSLVLHPADGFMQIITPPPTNTPYVQYNQNLSTKAWGFWESVPVTSAYSWNGEYFVGSTDGKVFIYDGVLDGTELPRPEIWQNVLVGALPAEWTEPVAGQFACDGAQVAETQVDFTGLVPAIAVTTYTVVYTVTGWSAGQHFAGFGDATTTPQSGGGTFRLNIANATSVSDVISIYGDVDFVGTISDISVSVAAFVGDSVAFRILTSFQSMNGTHASFKIPGFIRTIGVLAGTAALNVKAVFDYSIEATVPPPPVLPSQGSNVWDSALWDTNLWDFSAEGRSFPTGALGLGRTMAIAVTGSASSRINVVGWDVMFIEGGLL